MLRVSAVESTRAASLLLGADIGALGFATFLFLADKFIGLGPDGTLTGAIFLAFMVVSVLLLLALPPLIWMSAKAVLSNSDGRTILAVGATIVGVCIWLLVVALLVFACQSK